MESKLSPNDDPFCDNGTFENESQQSADTKGQITSYVTKQFASQFRTYAFSIIICKDMARLIYWDRSGAVVTKSLSYVKDRWLDFFFGDILIHLQRSVELMNPPLCLPTPMPPTFKKGE